MSLSRRGLIGSLLAAPFIVRTPGLLMPIKSLADGWLEALEVDWKESSGLYPELLITTRKVLLPKIHVQIYQTSPLLRMYLEKEFC